MESFEHSVLDTILEGRPMEGITCPELLECTRRLLDTSLDGGLVEKISDWEPVAHPVPDANLDGRPMEGTTNLEPLEHSVLVGSLDSGLMEGMSSLEPLEQSVLNTLLVAGITVSLLDNGQSNLESPTQLMLDITQDEMTDTDTDQSERSALATHLDYGLLNLESLSHPMVDVALDRRPLEGISAPLPVESSGHAMAPGRGPMEHLSESRPLEHSVLDIKVGQDKL